MRKYKEKDRVYIYWEKTPFARQILRESPKSIGVIKEIHEGYDDDGDIRDEYYVTGYDIYDGTKQIVLYENEISLYIDKVIEGDNL